MALSVPHVKAHVVLHSKNGITEDAVVNTLYYRPPGGTIPIDPGSGTVAVDNLAQAIDDFYSKVPTGYATSVAGFLGASVARGTGAITLKLYAIPITPVQILGPPFATRLLTIPGAAGATSYPSEVASCLTYHGDLNGIPERGPNNTRPASSRRGRMYIGPLDSFAGVNDATTGFNHAAPTFRGVVTESAAGELFGSADASSWRWVVFSKTLWEAHEVAGVWMNDAYDTQRRRGQAPTVKTNRPF